MSLNYENIKRLKIYLLISSIVCLLQMNCLNNRAAIEGAYTAYGTTVLISDLSKLNLQKIILVALEKV